MCPDPKKDSQVNQRFALSGSAQTKAAGKHVDEIDPMSFSNRHNPAENCKTLFCFLFRINLSSVRQVVKKVIVEIFLTFKNDIFRQS